MGYSLFERLLGDLRSRSAVRAARAAARSGDWNAAAEHYAVAVRKRRRSARLWVQLGHALKEIGAIEAAESAYRTAVRLAPADVEARRQLGHFLNLTSRRDEAVVSFCAGLTLAPLASDLRHELESYSLSPDDIDFGLYLGALALVAHPRPLPVSLLQRLTVSRARRAARRGEWAIAARHYRRIVASMPANVPMLLQLAHATKESGDLRGAEAIYRQAVVGAPFHAEAHLQHGHALKLLEQDEAARAAYVRAMRLDPGSGDARREVEAFMPRHEAQALIRHAWWDTKVPAMIVEIEKIRQVDRPWLPSEPSGQRGFRSPDHLTPREQRIWQDLAQQFASPS